MKLTGVFEGVLLGDCNFHFITDEGHQVGGKIDEDLMQEQVIDLNRQFFNERSTCSPSVMWLGPRTGCIGTTWTFKGLGARSEARG